MKAAVLYKYNDIKVVEYEIPQPLANKSQIKIQACDVYETDHLLIKNQFATGKAMKMLANRKIRIDNLISHHIALKGYLDGFKLFGGSDKMK